jgi:hypothetical protein
MIYATSKDPLGIDGSGRREQAVRLLFEHDIILLDWDLPKINRSEVLQLLKGVLVFSFGRG